MMKSSRWNRWGPLAAACTIGVFTFGFTFDLVSSTTLRASEPATLTSGGSGLPAKATLDPSIDQPRTDVTMVTVDYRDDEGTRLRAAGLLQGAMPIMFASPVATGGECTFAVDCIDGDPCTADSCDIEPGSPFGSGKCLNEPVPDGGVGGCSDGLFCNGLETCQGGVCEAGIPATCCTGEEVCMEDWGVCDDKSLNAGDPCQFDGNCREGPSGDTVRCDRCRPDCRVRLCNDGSTTCTANGDCPAVTGRCSNAARSCTVAAECPGGTCSTGAGTCLTNNQVCDDGNYCNGNETCDMGDGVCLTSTNPCGPGADCFFKKCTGGDTPNANCSIDANCPGGVCRIVATPSCFAGRCCNQATAEPSCGKVDAATCASQGREWYAGDGGQQTTEIGQNCGGFNPEVPVADAWGCPKYGSGITRTNASDNPVYLETIGPISGSPSSVTIGSFTGPLNSIGDDYKMTNTSHFGLDVLRFVGGLIVPNRIAIDFYDSSGNFIEDIILPAFNTLGQQTIVVAFNPALILPPEGFVVWRIAGNFAPNTQMFLMSTNDVDTGRSLVPNDPNVLWRNGASVANFLPNGAPGILSFELVGDKEPVPTGACCDPDTGDCNSEVEWVCRGQGGSFQEGLPCSRCVNGVNNGNPCRTCNGGGNDGNPCEANSECPDGTCAPDNGECAGAGSCSNNDEALCPPSLCPGIPGVCSNSTNLCTNNSQCPGGTCGGAGSCLTGTCQTAGCSIGACCIAGDCEPDHTPTSCAMASGVFQDFGSNCDNNCCMQPTMPGADQPAAAIVQVINVPAPGADPITITISGDNSNATSTEMAPDTCFGASNDIEDDPGWWEAFSIDACAHVRIDFCCTSPVHEPAWAFLSADPDCNVTFANGFPPDEFGEADNARGAPYCVEDNLWQWYTFLPAGDYFYPIYSVLRGHIGPYQLHITVQACTLAACCKPDGSCEDGLNQLECDAAGGLFLAPPQRSPSVAACTPGVCDSGSCCVAPGTCEDDRENDGNPMTEAACEGPGFNGIYVPNVKCEGGRCAGNDFSCNDDVDCTGGNGPCLGDAQQKAQENPCPICEHNTDSKCQHDPGAFVGTAYLADLSSTAQPTRIAEDVLITTTGTLQEICVIGAYIYFPGGVGTDCSGLENFGELTDQFRVRVYQVDPDSYVPGVLLGEYTTLIAENEDKPEFITGTFPFYRHQLSLVEGDDPLPVLEQDEIYFIEVTNNTVGGEPGCNWFWLNADETQGNDIFFQELGTNYTVSDAEAGGGGTGDVSICLNVQFDNPPTPIRACCTCDPQDPCQDTTLADCNAINGEWKFDTLSCTEPGFVCTVAGNDTCDLARVVGDGFQFWNNFCAGLDGATDNVCGDNPDTTATNDLWYHYTASCSGVLTVSLCDPQDDFIFDSVAYIYQNTSNPAVCNCPGDTGFAQVACDDESCGGFLALTPAEVQTSVIAGNCYTIRVSGFAGSNYDGVGKLRITCGDAVCGDNNRDVAAGEQCDGTDDALCDGECTVDCMCPTPVCGDNVAATLLGEDCDGTDDDACPGECRAPGDPLGGCTCPPVCGNGVREAPELCDGNDDALCPGLCIPGPDPNECRCVTTCGNNNAEVGEACDGTDDDACPGACNVDCTCPPAACGNNIVEVSLEEECDGTATEGALCEPEECRPPGDPAGECTCQCGATSAVDPVLPESPAVGKVRHISFVVPATSAGTDTALRVQLTSLHHPPSPPPGTPNFAAHEGGFRYVNSFGGSTTCVDSNTFATNFRCGQLGCQPEYRDWSTALTSATNPASPAGLIHVTGDTVVPSSTLNVSHIAAACGAAPGANSCTAASAAQAVSTSRWGDVGSGGGGAPDGNTNVIDIGLVVDNVKGLATAIPERRAWMKNPPNTFLNPVNVIDIGLTVDSVKGLPYPYTIVACP